MAARMLIGMLKYINDVGSRPADTLHINVTSNEKKTLYFFINCNAESVEDAMSKPIRDGYFEASFYQNLLDNLGIPDEIELDVEELMNH